MKWNDDKSLLLTRVCVWLSAVALVLLCVSAPWLFSWFIQKRLILPPQSRDYFLVTTYTVAVPAAVALYMMNRLLANIRKEEVFTEKNTRYLRGMSWCCLAAGLIFLVSSFYYLPFFALCAAAVFMALILRVIKNVFAQAEEIKKENDYTI
ncbi:DUF2975 domain-containing protein [Blautia sp. An81]|uniref:DUF2975 domain-containing protein n=1 Tax=Blautia sp. An81 TaxID=1965659 RepID=UPI000B3AA79D|nr:DUF2975 domain-containing protein [Blautia sp. An81]OUN29961.1 hypothetical protein B5G33_10300 [Blautia sp. An81]